MKIKGNPIDGFTRCVHYHSELDVIAIKFKCCDEFYPCYECHQEISGHQAKVWPKDEWNEKAILCGRCKKLMTIQQYFDSGNKCVSCGGNFNPKCANHYHLYFDIK